MSRTAWALADYLDEVDGEVNAFDAFVRDLEHAPTPADHCDAAFFGSWNQFVNAQQAGRYDNGRPYGWRAFFVQHRGLLDRYLGTVEPVWIETEGYEDELIRFWDAAIACGAQPPGARPKRAHQPPPPGETTEGQIATAVKYAAGIGAILAVGYALRGLPRKGA